MNDEALKLLQEFIDMNEGKGKYRYQGNKESMDYDNWNFDTWADLFQQAKDLIAKAKRT